MIYFIAKLMLMIGVGEGTSEDVPRDLDRHDTQIEVVKPGGDPGDEGGTSTFGNGQESEGI